MPMHLRCVKDSLKCTLRIAQEPVKYCLRATAKGRLELLKNQAQVPQKRLALPVRLKLKATNITQVAVFSSCKSAQL